MEVPGGLSETKPATAEVQQIADEVKPELEGKLNKTFGTFKAIEYKSQVVAGTNYYIKVQVSDNDYVHLTVYQSLPYENEPPRLVSYETGKTRDDPLD